MTPRLLRPMWLLSVCFVACDGEPAGPAGPLPPGEEPPVLPTYLMPLTIERQGQAPQLETVDLAGQPHSRFMGPFWLHVRNDEGTNVGGTIRLDGVEVLSLGGVAPGEEASAEIEPGGASRLTLELTGAVGGRITLRIEAALQPAPVIRITSPSRSAMLELGSYEAASVEVTGDACHGTFPITELIVNGAAVAVSGANLCEPFAVILQSGWGMSTIDVSATNQRGRSARRVQSFLRSPSYYAPALTINPDIARDTTTDVSWAQLVRFERFGMDKLAAMLVRWLGEQPFTVGSSIPATIADTWGGRPACLDLNRTASGYRVQRGTIEAARRAIAARIANEQTMDVDLAFMVTVPVTVTAYNEFRCSTTTVTRTGTVSLPDASASGLLRFGIVATDGRGGVYTQVAERSSSAGLVSLNLDLTGSGLSAAQIAEVEAAIYNQVTANTVSDAREFMIGIGELGELFENLYLPADGLAALGLEFESVARAVRLFLGSGDVVFTAQVAPATPRAGDPPARGALRSLLVTSDASLLSDMSLSVGDDLTNQMLWAAWQAGRFDADDLLELVGPVEGLALDLHSTLPPVLMPGADGRVRIAWGDASVSATIDPAFFGLYESGVSTPVETQAFGSIVIDGLLHFDSLTNQLVLDDATAEAAVEVEAVGTTLLDEEMVVGAVESALEAAALRMIGEVIAATPIATADLTGVFGMSAGTMLELDNTNTARRGPFQLVTGSFAFD